MGRKRVSPDEKRIAIKLSIQKKLLDELKAKNVNISQLFEEFVRNYLKK